jgi:cytochrome c
MRASACLSIAAACLTLSVVPASAQSVPGDVQRGRELSERLCSNCHKVNADAAGPVSTDVLSFPSIANRPGVTAESLAGRIIFPHPAMPGVQLTVRELREVVAYILSLKRTN